MTYIDNVAMRFVDNSNIDDVIDKLLARKGLLGKTDNGGFTPEVQLLLYYLQARIGECIQAKFEIKFSQLYAADMMNDNG